MRQSLVEKEASGGGFEELGSGVNGESALFDVCDRFPSSLSSM